MCELFALSSRQPVPVTYSLDEFTANGSRVRDNRDGWGISLARDRDAFFVKEPRPASNSIWARLIAENPIETTAAIAHVRYATRGEHTMENTHPFRRALGRHTHVFAHNGTLEGIDDIADIPDLAYRPIGDTDSELAFCLLLMRLKQLYEKGDMPALDERFSVFRDFCSEMASFGPSNFLYHDGDTLFAHAHKRIYEVDGKHVGPKPPGMQLKRCWTCTSQKEVQCSGLSVGLPDTQVVLLASVPLDDQGWEALEEGTVLALKDGEVVAQER